MDYESSNEFIKKLESKNYEIGSFDVYLDKTKELIKENSNLTDEEVLEILSSMPTTYRASIISKDTKEYVGYIGIHKIDAQHEIASVRFEVVNNLSDEHKEEITETYLDFIGKTLNINNIENFDYITKGNVDSKKETFVVSNIVIPNEFLESSVSKETLEKYRNWYNVPNLSMPFTIKANNQDVGIIGLSNLIWSNKRASLNIFFDKNFDDDLAIELGSYIIDKYLVYLQESNIHNVTTSVSGSDKEKLEIIKNSSMNYYGTIPFYSSYNGNIESSHMFQSVPGMKKENGLYIPENKILIDTNKTKDETSRIIEFPNGYRAIVPSEFEKEKISLNEVVKDHIKAMQHREDFTMPLGEDKYFIQEGNGKYGMSKAVANYSYVLFDENNHYSGYINILRTNAENKNAELEIGIKPDMQNKGLGTMLLNSFYNELFSVGYASVTSTIFEFNKPSLKLHEKVAEFNGSRIDCYYINGKLWDMNFYTKVNPEIVSRR